MATDPGGEAAELRALLAAAEEVLARAAAEAGLEPGVAAAACAALAEEYAAVFAAGRREPPGPVLEEAARVLRRRGERAHRALRPGEEGEGEGGAGVRSPRRRPSRAGHEAGADGEPRAALLPRSWPPFWRWRRFLGLPRGDRDGVP
jgi:hypothetical protein